MTKYKPKEGDIVQITLDDHDHQYNAEKTGNLKETTQTTVWGQIIEQNNKLLIIANWTTPNNTTQDIYRIIKKNITNIKKMR